MPRVVNRIVEGDGDTRHGTANGYTNHGCRCAACRQANTEYYRAYRSKVRASGQYAGQYCPRPGCNAPVVARGLCASCYSTWLQRADQMALALFQRLPRQQNSHQCARPNCSRRAIGRGLCQSCYGHWWRQNGRLDIDEYKARPRKPKPRNQ